MTIGDAHGMSPEIDNLLLQHVASMEFYEVYFRLIVSVVRYFVGNAFAVSITCDVKSVKYAVSENKLSN